MGLERHEIKLAINQLLKLSNLSITILTVYQGKIFRLKRKMYCNIVVGRIKMHVFKPQKCLGNK